MALSLKSVARHNDGFILIGKILGAHGIRGALKVKSLSDFPERFLELQEVWLSATDPPQAPQCLSVEDAQFLKGDQWMLWLASIQDRTEAEHLGRPFLYVPRSQALELPENTFYADELIGYAVLSDTGESLGMVTRVMPGQQDLLEFRAADDRLHLIPFVQALVPEVNEEQRWLKVHLVEGLLEL